MGHKFVYAAVSSLAFCGMTFTAMPAAAAEMLINSAGIYDYVLVNVTGTPTVKAAGAGTLRLTGTDSTGSWDFNAFCVDLANKLYAGKGVQKAVNHKYDYGSLTEDGYGNLLSATQRSQMKGLAALGFTMTSDPSKANDIAAIQIAIWTVEYPDAVFTTKNAAVTSLVSDYLALAPSLTGKVRYLYSVDSKLRQGILVPGVPEPAAWTMLIAGFGLVGVAMRRRQRMVVSA